MIQAVTHGRPGTAMNGFANTISNEDITLVVDFVRQEFIEAKALNTSYHTVENGWPNHKQYAPAFPFALGEIAIDSRDDELTSAQQIGKRIFMQSCITCHDRARVNDEGVIWEPRAVSYPRDHYSHRESERAAAPPDSVSGATPYARHDQAPTLINPTEQEREGEQLYQNNCAFCHAADGTGKNWIGSFLEPHPRNLTDPDNMRDMTVTRLRQVIREGLPDTSMPAWKDVLDAGQIAAVITYINRAFHTINSD
jgi:cytochrome c oxidase cbb3-type subunit 3